MQTVTHSFYTPSKGDVIDFLHAAGINAGEIAITNMGLIVVTVYSGVKDAMPRKLFQAGGLFDSFQGDRLFFRMFPDWRKKATA